MGRVKDTLITDFIEDSDDIILSEKPSWTVEETPEQFIERGQFEYSHPFKVGDKVILKQGDSGNSVFSRRISENILGIVTRIQTTPATGPCIQVNFNGAHLNIWKPNEELIFANNITDLLYEV